MSHLQCLALALVVGGALPRVGKQAVPGPGPGAHASPTGVGVGAFGEEVLSAPGSVCGGRGVRRVGEARPTWTKGSVLCAMQALMVAWSVSRFFSTKPSQV